MTPPPIDPDRREIADTPTLRASLNEGMANAAMVGAGESYLSTFGIFLQGTPLQIGTLATLPPLMGALFQNAGLWAVESIGRRRMLCTAAAFFHGLIWIPILLLPFVIGPGFLAAQLLIVLAVLYHCAAGFGIPIWNSLIGDLVPPEQRGVFFGYRNKMCGLTTFAGLIVGGVVLELMRDDDMTGVGFALIFSCACVARIISSQWLRRYDDPPYRPRRDQRFTFWDFLRRMPRSNFAKFVLFISAMNFAVQFSAPYFAIYMLRELHFSYLQFMAITAMNVFAQFITIQRWGAFSDRFGNKKILNISAIGVAASPLIWLLTTDFWVILLFHLYSGFVWAGFNLCAANFMFDAVSPPKRARCSAYQALVNGVFVFSGSLLGGYCATNLPVIIPFDKITGLPVSNFPDVFFGSILLRCLVVAVFLKLFREVRAVEMIRHRDLIFQITHLRPIAGATFGVVTGFIRPRKGTALKPDTAGTGDTHKTAADI